MALTPEEEAELLSLLEAEEAAKPRVGAGQTFVSRGAAAVPLGGLVSDLTATTIMQARRKLGLDAPGVEVTPAARGEMAARGMPGPIEQPSVGPVDEYRQIRDTRRERTDLGSEQNPWAGRLGTATGIAASVLAPLPKVLPKSATASSRIAAGTKTGAGYGALAGLTEGRADLTQGQVLRAALETLGGGLAGGVLGGAASAAAEAIGRPLAQAVQRWGIDRGRKLLTSGSGQLSTKEPVPAEAVMEAYRAGAITPFGSATKAREVLDPAQAKASEAYGQLLGELEKRGVTGPNAVAIAEDLWSRGEAAQLGKDPRIVQEFFGQADDLLNRSALAEARGVAPPGRLGLSQAEEIKRTLQSQAKYGDFKDTPLNQTKKQIAAIVRQANEAAVDEAGAKAGAGSEISNYAGQFVPVKQRLGRLSQALEAAELGSGREAFRTGGGVGSAFDAIQEAALLGPKGIAAKVGLGLAKRAATSSQAATALRLADALERGATGGSARGLSAAELQLLADALGQGQWSGGQR